MKPLGIIFVLLGLFLTLLGFVSYASDIQLIVAFIGICMAGIGAIMISVAGIKNDLFSLYQWVKKDK
ncbi:MAG: hypothetical protein F2672_04705 [Actinobacteria bacterium]|uniref:Unannotated protein n=1 Tax=freshwater metagenome TaxID=449393 RepID=A0A6J6QCE7_9ZZZZ|nr:hypothetical protein [Actinomycetota bacterium]